MSNTTSVTMTKEEWMAKGEELFGKDQMQWRFRCPTCGHIQRPEDFRVHKDKGANPKAAYQECIGRYDKTSGCDWCAYGLFSGPNFVKDGDKEIPVFSFDEEEQ